MNSTVAPGYGHYRRSLINKASAPYRQAGRFAYRFARGKLSADPVFTALLERGLLRGHDRILDLGCGQGLLSNWLRSAHDDYRIGSWPIGWPPPPTPKSIRGIELMLRDVERARDALGEHCEVQQGDIRTADFGSTDAVVILDVLHYMTPDEQRAVLTRVRAALPQGGALLLRIGDASAGLRFRYSQLVDKVVMLCRGHTLNTTHCRSVEQWRDLLVACGFTCEWLPMSQGTRFANVLFVARAV